MPARGNERTQGQLAPMQLGGPVWRKGHYPEFFLEAFRYLAERRRWTASHGMPELPAAIRLACEVLGSISTGSEATTDDDAIRSGVMLSKLVEVATRYVDLIDAADIIARQAVQPERISDRDRAKAGELAKSLTRLAR